MVAVPQWADQPMNAMCLKDVRHVAVQLQPEPGTTVVRGEVERCVCEVMEGANRCWVQEESPGRGPQCEEGVSEGGSSNTNILEFI